MPEIIDESEISEVSFTEGNIKTDASRHYVDDIVLTQILTEWSDRCREAKKSGLERPILPAEAGVAIFNMTEAMGVRHNFSNYSYLDEMKSDAMIHCIKYLHNFNPNVNSEKKARPSAFSYINKIIWQSFTNRIMYEKREQYLKYVSFELMGGMDAFKGEDSSEIFGFNDEGEQLSISVVGQDFILKAKEYEDQYINNRPKKAKKHRPGKDYDNFMFELDDLPEELNID